MEKPELIALARATAEKYGLDPSIVCSVVEQESNWDQYAIRYEPGFMAKYISPKYTSGGISASEAYARSTSWGLMQVMGEVARELGYQGAFLSSLCDPAIGLEYGCKKLSALYGRMGNDTTKSLLAYNGGGDSHYADAVLARVAGYAA